MRTEFTTEEIKIAEEQGLSAEGICLMQNGFNPAFMPEENPQWLIHNAFFQGDVEQDDAAAHSLMDKFAGEF